MADFRFGDLVCYRYDRGKTAKHDGPILYLGRVSSRWTVTAGALPDDITLLVLETGQIWRKDPARWQKCVHFEPPAVPASGIEVFVDGRKIEAIDARLNASYGNRSAEIVISDKALFGTYAIGQVRHDGRWDVTTIFGEEPVP